MDELEDYPQSILEIFEEGFRCNYCGEKFSEDKLILSTKKYGVFFMFGKKTCYVGTNCSNPECQKTLLLETEGERQWEVYDYFHLARRDVNAWTVKEATALPGLTESENKRKVPAQPLSKDVELIPAVAPNFGFGEAKAPRYFSSVSYSPEQFKELDGLGVRAWRPVWSEHNDIITYESELDSYLQEYPVLSEKLYCSYFNKRIQPIGDFSVWWFTEEHISKIYKLENTKGLRIFPRYAVANELYSHIDHFCWKYYLESEWLADFAVYNENLLNAKKQDPNLFGKSDEKLLEDFLDIVPVEDVRMAEQANKNNLKFDTEKISAFFKILKLELDGTEEQHKLHEELMKVVITPYNEGRLNRLLEELSGEFIQKYIQQFQTQGFCYQSAWDLKEGYLQRIGEEWQQMRTHQRAEEKPLYAFYRSIASTEIIFNGKSTGPISNDGNQGLRFIYEIVKGQGEPVLAIDLDNIFADDRKRKAASKNKEEIEIDKKSKPQKRFDKKALKEVLDELNEYNQLIDEAENFGDDITMSKYMEKKEQLLSSIKTDAKVKELENGEVIIKPMAFGNPDIEKVKGRVAKSIRDVLKKIKSIDEKLHDHLDEAIVPKKAWELHYRPEDNVRLKVF